MYYIYIKYIMRGREREHTYIDSDQGWRICNTF